MVHIIRKELKELTRDGRIKITAIISIILLIIAAITEVSNYQKESHQHEESVSKERAIWESQEAKNPHAAAHYGTYIFKPKFALSLIDGGVTNYTGNSIFVEAHNKNEASFSSATDQTSLARFGSLSINFVLLYLFPLISILIGYNSYTKEREHQTYWLLKSQGVHPIKLVVGKWLATFLPILVLTTTIFLVIGSILANISDLEMFKWVSLWTLWGLYLLYYLIITTLTILISMWSKSSGVSLVSCLLIWILFSFITPKFATNIANVKNPYPSKSEFNTRISNDKKQGLDGHNPWNEAAKKLESETLKNYGVESIDKLPFNYVGYRMQKGEEHEAKVYQKHYAALKTIATKQNDTYKQLSFISPFIALRFLSMDLANSSDNLHWKFSEAVEKYRIQKQRFLNYDIKDNSKFGERGYKMTPEKFKNLPKFSFNPPTLSELLKNNTKNLFFLMLWLVLPFLGLLMTSKKI
jgi:ABC-2 type transport system permease protein